MRSGFSFCQFGTLSVRVPSFRGVSRTLSVRVLSLRGVSRTFVSSSAELARCIENLCQFECRACEVYREPLSVRVPSLRGVSRTIARLEHCQFEPFDASTSLPAFRLRSMTTAGRIRTSCCIENLCQFECRACEVYREPYQKLLDTIFAKAKITRSDSLLTLRKAALRCFDKPTCISTSLNDHGRQYQCDTLNDKYYALNDNPYPFCTITSFSKSRSRVTVSSSFCTAANWALSSSVGSGALVEYVSGNCAATSIKKLCFSPTDSSQSK